MTSSDVRHRAPRRVWRLIFRVGGLIVGIPLSLLVLILAIALVAANTGAGQRYLERETSALTGGTVLLQGISGRFPDAMKIRHLALRDAAGVWLSIDGLSLDWSPTRLALMTLRVNRLAMERLSIPRLPAPSSSPQAKGKDAQGQSSLHLGVDIAALHMARIEVGRDLAGTDAVLMLDGRARLATIAPIISGAISPSSLPDADIAMTLARLDVPGEMSLTTSVTPGTLALSLRASEGAGGFMTRPANLEQFDPVQLRLDMTGPRRAQKLDFALQAGSVTSSVVGVVNLLSPDAHITIKAHAPATSLPQGVAWKELSLDTTLNGALSQPTGKGVLAVDGLQASGIGLGALRVTFDATNAPAPRDSFARLHAVATGLNVPGGDAGVFASAPMELDLRAQTGMPRRPVTVSLAHPLLQLAGTVLTAGGINAVLDLSAPDLKPLAALGGGALAGHAKLHVVAALADKPSADSTLALDGVIAVTGGQPQALALIGDAGKFSLDAATHVTGGAAQDGRVIDIRHLVLDGRGLHLEDSGHLSVPHSGSMELDDHATATLPDLRLATPALRGNAKLDLAAKGPIDDLAATASIDGLVGTSAVEPGPIALQASLEHLPGVPTGSLSLSGTLDKKPVDVRVALSGASDGARHVVIDKLDWASLSGQGDLALAKGARVPTGSLDLKMARLADLQGLIGQPVSGAISVMIRTAQQVESKPAVVTLDVGGTVATRQASVGHLALAGTIADPIGDPDAMLTLQAGDISAQGIIGSAEVTAKGKQDALALALKSDLKNLAGGPATADIAALLDMAGQNVQLQKLDILAKGERIHLLAPARIGFGKVLGVDRLRASFAPQGVAPANIDIAGTIRPALSLNAAIDNLTPNVAKPFMPSLDATGTISAHAKLSGTIDRPQGNADLAAHGLRMRTGPGASVPAAELAARLALAGTSALLDASLHAGSLIDLALRGTAPTTAQGAIALRADGKLDLSAANGVLGESGRAAKGIVRMALAIGGTAASPTATGQIDVAGGDIQDFAQGAHLSDIKATIIAQGSQFTIRNFEARGGKGKIDITGSVGALAPGLPVDLHIHADKITPLTSDLLTATISSDIAIQGQASRRLNVAGKVRVDTATINIPNSMPASVAQLNVVRPGDKPVSNDAGGGVAIGLDVAVISPGYLFVRGHGLDAEMSGKIHVGGLASAPVIDGGFDLRRGNFNLAGINLNFTHGRVGFNGSGVTQKLDPSLDFQADRSVNGTTARLNVGGYASNPKITFSANPSQPQDQVLALLLFGKQVQELSTTELAEIGGALAVLTGGSSFDPLGTVRNALGLDRLQLGGGSGVGNGGSSVEAGKYVMRGVYVGAKQATSGSGTQAQVQIDLTKRLKVNTTVGTGGNVTGFTTPENDPGSSVGLLYQFDY